MYLFRLLLILVFHIPTVFLISSRPLFVLYDDIRLLNRQAVRCVCMQYSNGVERSALLPAANENLVFDVTKNARRTVRNALDGGVARRRRTLLCLLALFGVAMHFCAINNSWP